MRRRIGLVTAALCAVLISTAGSAALAAAAPEAKPLTVSNVIAASKPGDWRPLDPQRTLYMDLDAGRVIIELTPEFSSASNRTGYHADARH